MNYKNTTFLLIILTIVSCLNSSASPAYPGLISFVQPDGSKINIYLKGDERVHWAETEDGYSLLFNAQGAYEYAILDGQGDMVPSGKMARNAAQRSNDDQSFLLNVAKHLMYSKSQVGISRQIGEITKKSGNVLKSFPAITQSGKLLCILIGFKDKAFTKTKVQFENLFNQVGYSDNSAVGSVYDFYKEASYGKLKLDVTVAGPYEAKNNFAYYGSNNDALCGELITQAIQKADSDAILTPVNFNDFVTNSAVTPKEVGGVYVIYAGYGEEGGGSTDCIWAHSNNISVATTDGPTVKYYSCSPELSGHVDSYITNIGVICHEFGHMLGSYDFYDSNGGTDGLYNGTGQWDLMATGMWNNAGITPAQPSAYNKCDVYKWATATNLTTLISPITIQNSSVQPMGSFYRMNTTTPHEYFLFENRQQVGFDASLPGHGMLVYHVDSTYIAAHEKPNDINAGSHQGMYIMPANSTNGSGVSLSEYSNMNTSSCPFPIISTKTSFTDATNPHSNSWAGASTKIPIMGITENNTDKTVSFTYNVNDCIPPTNQASNIKITSTTETSMTVKWRRGNGSSVLVVARASTSDPTNPLDGTPYTGNVSFGSGNQIGSGNFVVFDGVGTSVTVSNLPLNSTFYFSVYERSSTYCYKTPALIGNCKTNGFCVSTGNTYDQTGITRVLFKTIDNVTLTKSYGYNDYTRITTSISKGSSYPITVNLNTGGPYTAAGYVWIDWNHNNSFEDAGEYYNLGTALGVTDGASSLSGLLKITVPLNARTGPTRMRVACQDTESPDPCKTNFYGEVEDYTVTVISPESIWASNGGLGQDANWENAANWNPTSVPSYYSNVTIPVDLTTYPLISGSDACDNLTIASGAKLTIGTTGSISVNESLINNNKDSTCLVLESTSVGTGSLKILGSVTGPATVNRYMTHSQWHIISPPAIESLSLFLKTNKDIPFLLSNSTNLGMTDYGTDNWNGYFTISTLGNLTVGKSYLVRTVPDAGASPPPTILSFKGTLKSGTTDVPVIAGWNCIGNPFTSAISINGTAGESNNFMGLNLAEFDPNNACIYIWDENTQPFTEYKAINYSDSKIYASVGQGFFIKAAATSSVNFNPDMQVHQDSISLKTASTANPTMRLIASNKNQTVSTTIKFIEGTSRGLDVGYDAGLFKSDNPITLYTKLVEDNGIKFQLQCLPTNQYNSLVVPIGLDSKAGGEIVFSVETAQLDPNCKVILEDKLSNTFTDLSTGTYKTSVAANTSVADRFFLHTSDIVSGLEGHAFPGKLSAYAVSNVEIRVIGEVSGKAMATLYNGLGKVVLTKKLSSGNLNIIGLPNLSSGVYLLNINDMDTSQTIKIMVRK